MRRNSADKINPPNASNWRRGRKTPNPLLRVTCGGGLLHSAVIQTLRRCNMTCVLAKSMVPALMQTSGRDVNSDERKRSIALNKGQEGIGQYDDLFTADTGAHFTGHFPAPGGSTPTPGSFWVCP